MGAQIKAEFKLLSEFFAIADSHGVLPPDIGYQLSGIFDSRRQPSVLDDIGAGRWSWLPDDLLYLAAVAQHHGLPTRLLDWTQHPFIAAYFAARSIVRLRPAPRGKLVVWAFNVHLHESEATLRGLKGLPYQPIRIIKVSAAGNANLHAQRGVFTLFRPEQIGLGEPVDRRPLDELMSTVDPLIPGQWAMKRFTLPISQAAELMRLLRAEGVTAARLFPGLSGVVDAMHDFVLARI